MGISTSIQRARDGMKKNKVLFTLEEEALLNGFGQFNTGKSSASFYLHAFYVSLIPIWLQARIHQLDIMSSIVFLIVGTIAQTAVIQMAYKNIKFVKKDQIATQRTQAITKEIAYEFGTKMNKDEVAEAESANYAVFFVNALYLAVFLFSSFFLLKSNTAFTNYIFSVFFSIATVLLFSTKRTNKA